jgi:hypothetical protein
VIFSHLPNLMTGLEHFGHGADDFLISSSDAVISFYARHLEAHRILCKPDLCAKVVGE